jgi:hypothetical protein
VPLILYHWIKYIIRHHRRLPFLSKSTTTIQIQYAVLSFILWNVKQIHNAFRRTTLPWHVHYVHKKQWNIQIGLRGILYLLLSKADTCLIIIHTQSVDVNKNFSSRYAVENALNPNWAFGHDPKSEPYSSVAPLPPISAGFIKVSWREALYYEGLMNTTPLPAPPQSWRTEYRLSHTLHVQHIYPSAIWRLALNQFTQNYTAETQWTCLYLTETVTTQNPLNKS